MELHRPYTHLSSEAPRLPHQSRSSVLARSVHLHDDSELPERTNLTHSRHHRLAVPTFASVVDLVNSDDEGESKSSRDGANSAPISSGTEKEPIDLTTVPDPSPPDPISDAISNKKCPICMDSFNKITSTTCGHVFCRFVACFSFVAIFHWLAAQRLHSPSNSTSGPLSPL